MARDIVIWCDPCLAEDVRTPAMESVVALTLGEIKSPLPRVLATCEAHADQYLKPLAALLEEFGSPVEVPEQAGRGGKKRSQQVSIPAGPSGPQQDRTLFMLEQNGSRKGKPPTGPRGNQCLWCPLSYSNDGGGFSRHLKVAHGFNGMKEAFGGVCPVCGEGQYELMGAHTKKAHAELGFATIPEAFLWARDNGDPHGVYAEILERKGSLDPKEEWEKTREKERSSPAAKVKKADAKS